jgi:hypothetical protein
LRVDGTAWTFRSNGFHATGALYEGRIAYLTLGGNLTRRGIEVPATNSSKKDEKGLADSAIKK